MTAVHSVGRLAPGSVELTLRDLLSDAVGLYLNVVGATESLDAPVRGVAIWDDAGVTQLEPGDLVLAIGVVLPSGLPVVLGAAARAGAAAVVVKRLGDPEQARSEAEFAGVAVLSAPPELSWEELNGLLRASIDARSTTGPGPATTAVSRAADEDLFSLVETAATALGGAVEIDDANMRPLAYSQDHGQFDELRRRSILERAAPAEFMEWAVREGVLRRLRATRGSVLVEKPGCWPRLAVAVTAGPELLGYAWLVRESPRFDERTEVAFADIAHIASGVLQRLRSLGDTERRLRAGLLRGALAGTASPTALTDHLRPEAGTSCLVAFDNPAGRTATPDTRHLLGNLVTLRLEMAALTAVVTVLDGRVFALVAGAGTVVESVRAVAAVVVDQARTQLGAGVLAAVGDVLPNFEGLPRARMEVERLLELLAQRAGTAVGTAGTLRSHLLLAELRDMAAGRPALLRGPVQVLHEFDRARRTDYVATLQQYCAAQFDYTEAAKRLGVHRNTLRYRVARLQEISGLELSDPVERLVAELQIGMFPDR